MIHSNVLHLLPVERPPGMPPNDRRSMLQVRDRLSPPRVCPHCCCAVRLVNNSLIYGRSYGEWPWVYLCTNRACAAYVGVHPCTDLPLGTLATAVVRVARKRAKTVFNGLWESGLLSRSEAYARLAKKMGIPEAECHFGWFDAEQCKHAAGAAALLQAELRGA